MHQKPCGITARTAARFQRFLGALHARFHADDVIDGGIDGLIDLDQEIDRALLHVRETFV
jgi:hypothetical protein